MYSHLAFDCKKLFCKEGFARYPMDSTKFLIQACSCLQILNDLTIVQVANTKIMVKGTLGIVEHTFGMLNFNDFPFIKEGD